MIHYRDQSSFSLASPFLFSNHSTRLIQIQPTLKCNLSCLHCYSESGPGSRDELPASDFYGFLDQTFDLGYNYVGVSGGEPILWSGLYDFLEHAKKIGFSTSIISNGTLFSKSSMHSLKGLADIIAVSVDGPPKEHNTIRNSGKAFSQMQQGLSILRQEGIPFSMAFTLTKYNAHQVEWLYNFAKEEGAKGINIHPLSSYGNASKNLMDAIPDTDEFRAASTLLALLIEINKTPYPTVTLDIMKREQIEKSNWLKLWALDNMDAISGFSNLIPSLIVDPRGFVYPFIYGFPEKFSMGKITNHDLRYSFLEWIEENKDRIQNIIISALKRSESKGENTIDLFSEMLMIAHLDKSNDK